MRNTIIRREVRLDEDVELEDCIIQDYVHIKRGAHLRRVIVGSYSVIPAGARIGYDREADSRQYHVTSSGIVVVAPGEVSNAMDAFSGGA